MPTLVHGASIAEQLGAFLRMLARWLGLPGPSSQLQHYAKGRQAWGLNAAKALKCAIWTNAPDP